MIDPPPPAAGLGTGAVGSRSDSPDVVAVPGLGLSGAVPRRFLDRMPRSSQVVELPGLGFPAPLGTPLRPADLARRTLDEITARHAVLVGHSASCQVVVEAAVQAPERVAALVLIGPTTDPRARTWPRLTARWLRTAVWERPGQVPVLLHDYRRTGWGSMRRGLDAARVHDIRPALAAVAVPVLVLRGRHDRICPQAWADELAGIASRGRAHTLSAGAHMVPLTRPDELATAVGAFLTDVLADRTGGGGSA